MMNILLSFILGIITILIVVIVGFLIWLNLERRKLSHLPGSKITSILFGNLDEIKEISTKGGTFGEYNEEMHKRYGPVVRCHFFHLNFAMLCDKNAVKEVFITSNFPKPKIGYEDMRYLFGTRFMGDGLVTLNDKKIWAWKRAILNPAFQKSHLRKLEDDFNEVSDLFMNRLEKLADGKRNVKMLDEFNHMALDMIAKVAYAVDLKSVESDDNQFTRAISKSFEGLAKNAEDRFLRLKPWKWGYVKSVTDSLKMLRKYTREQMSQRVEAMNKGDHVPEDILSFILKLKESDPDISEDELLDEFVTFFVAGQETTGSLMACMVLSLAQNPDVLLRLVKEIDDVVGKKVVINQDDLNKLTYLDMVVKETLRLYPSVGQISRITTKPMEVKGYTIPVGTILSFCIYTMARSEEFFDDPLTFDPERFSPDLEKKVDPYSYFPFSLGPRTCIGRYFADIEAKTVMTKILQRFTFELVPDQPMGMVDTLTRSPKGRVQCVLRIRDD